MKTKEFIEEIKLLDLRVEKINDTILVGDTNRYYCCLSRVERYELEIFHRHFEKLEEDVRHKLLYTVVEYIKTPVEEREEPKKYYLRLPKAFTEEEYSYLNYITDGFGILSGFRFDSKDPCPKFNQTKFTQKEIDNLPNQEFIKSLIKEEV